MLHHSGHEHDENARSPVHPSSLPRNRRPRSDSLEDPLTMGPRKRPYVFDDVHFFPVLNLKRAHRTRTDPLVSNGRHFGRTIHAFCRPFPLLKEGLARFLQVETGLLTVGDLSDEWVVHLMSTCAS